MPVQEVGVRAIFDTANFSAGLKRYIEGLEKAEAATNKAVAALNEMAKAFDAHQISVAANASKSADALKEVAKAAREAKKATASSGGDEDEVLSDLQRQLEIQRLIKEEVKARISEQKAGLVLLSKDTSDLAKTTARAEQEMIRLFRELRDIKLPSLDLPTDFFDAIRQAKVDLGDLGNQVKSQTKQQAAEFAILAEEVRDRVRLERLITEEATGRLTPLQHEANLLEQMTLELAKQQRLEAAARTNPNLVPTIESIRKLPVQQADLGGISADEARLRLNRLLATEIKDRVRLEQIQAEQLKGNLTALQAQLLNLERQNIQLEQAKRLTNDLLDENDRLAIAQIRAAQVTAADQGIPQEDRLAVQVTQLRLIQEELQAQLELKRLSLILTNEQSSAFEKETATLARQSLELEAQLRLQQARKVGLNEAVLADVRKTVIKPSDLGQEQEQIDPLEKALALNKLIQAELKARISLVKAVETQEDGSASAIARQNAGLEASNLLLERFQRLAQFVKLGGDPAQLEAINGLLVTAADLQKNVNADTEKQVGIQRLLLEEIAARVDLERQSQIINDAKATTLQKQAAQLRIQQITLEQTLRDQKGTELGVPGGALNNIRQAKVETEDLGTAQKETTGDMKGLTTAAVAQGVIIGQLAVNALRSLTNALLSSGREILTNVAIFERLNLGIGFFAAQAKNAGGAALTYQQKIASTADEAEGLMFWLQKIAIASPFTTQDVANLFRTSRAYGLLQKEAEVLTPLLVDFASAAGLDKDVLERLALAMGQVRARGKLTGEEVRQLGNSGIPIRDILVKTLGIANEKFDELLESGAITSNIAIPAIVKALKEFQGAGEAVAFGTIGGLVSAFQDLQQIASAKFFKAALDPLREAFKSFFDVANNPATLATIQALGEEVGGGLVVAFEKLRTMVGSTIEAIVNLDPALKQQIVVFVGMTAVILGAVAAYGLMVTAIGILTNPIVGLTLLAAFLVSEWTAHWRTLRDVTSAGAKFLKGVLEGVGTFLIEAVKLWANGIGAVAKFLTEVISTIGQVLTFWLAPGSPPRVAPHIDDWGESTIEVYTEGMKRFGFDGTFKTVRKSVEKSGRQLVPALAETGFLTMDGYAKAIENADMIGPVAKVTGSLTDALGSDEVVGDAEDAAIRVSEAYVNAFGALVPKFKALVDPELTEAIQKLGSGAQLTRAGALSFGKFIEGFKQADFSALDDIAGVVQGFMQAMVDSGDLEEGDMIVQMFGTRQDIANAIKEFRQFGAISESTLRKVASASFEGGAAVTDLLQAYTKFAAADDTLIAAQTRLTEVTKRYEAVLKPIRAELERISDLRQRSDEDQEILALRRLINNEAVSEFRKENARLKIQEILQGRQVRGIEQQQKSATDAAQADIDAAQKKQEAAQVQLDLVKAQVQAQLQQVNLVAQEAQLMEKLREQIENLQKKQKTDLDLQQELLKLRSAELDDNVKAAKAKFILDQADSSEVEKQQAIFDLQNVALSRQQRLVEARELGIPEEQLTSLRDMAVTLDDIGEKGKDGLGDLGKGLDGLTESTVNAKEEAKKWQAELEKARLKIQEVKEKLGEMFQTINDNLPSWLKIFPEKEGETPPILTTLDKYKWAILGVAGVMIGTRIVAAIGTLLGAFGWLAGSWGAVRAGAAAGGAIATTGGQGAIALATGATNTFATALGALGVAILTPLGFILALGAALVAFNLAWVAFQNSKIGKITLGFQTGPIANDALVGKDLSKPGPLIEGDIFANPFADPKNKIPAISNADKTNIIGRFQKQVSSIVGTGVENGLSAVDIAAQVTTALNQGIAKGTIPDDPVVRKSAIDFMNLMLNAYRFAGKIKSPSELSAEEIGTPFGQGILNGARDALVAATAPDSEVMVGTAALVNALRAGMMGADGLLPFRIGSTWVTQLSAGITNQQQVLADAMVGAINFGLGQAQQAFNSGQLNPFAGTGVAANNPVATRTSQIFPGGTTNFYNTRIFNLTVNSAAQSQGIVRDFGIMQTLSEA